MHAQRVVLLACGSFSPLTPMHLRMFEIAKDHFHTDGNYQVVGGIISPVHDSYGKKGLVSATHRCAMVKLALQSSDWIRLSDWECGQNEWLTTKSILQYHQNYLNNYLNGSNDSNNEILPGWLPEGIRNRKDKIQIKLLCGADLLESFSVPGLWAVEDIEEIVGNHGIVVISRNGANPEKYIFESDLLTMYKKNITIITNWVPNEVSSTMIRRLLQRGQSVKYLIDDLVIDYIKMHSLFEVNSNNDEYMNQINLINDDKSASHSEEEDMDETDYSLKKTLISVNLENGRPKVFCCGNDAISVKTILNRPGQAVQVVTNSPASRPTSIDDKNQEVKAKKLKTTVYPV